MVDDMEGKEEVRSVGAKDDDRFEVFCMLCDVAVVNLSPLARGECMERIDVN